MLPYYCRACGKPLKVRMRLPNDVANTLSSLDESTNDLLNLNPNLSSSWACAECYYQLVEPVRT